MWQQAVRIGRNAQSRLGRLFVVLEVMCCTVAAFTALRWVLLARHVEAAELSGGDLFRVLLVGLKFDLLVAGLFVLPLAVLTAAATDRWINTRTARGLLELFWFLGFLMLPLMCLVELMFFEEFDTRLNYIAFEYLVYPTEICCNVWESYPVIPLFAGVTACGAGLYWAMRRRFIRLTALPVPAGRRWSVLASLAAGVGGLWLATDWGNTQIGVHRVVNECSGNGWYSFTYYAWTCRFDYDQFYLTMDQNEAAERLRRRVVRETDYLRKNAPHPIDRLVRSQRPRRDLNVVIILEESFGADFVGVLGDDRGLTPRFDALAKQGLLFDNFYATGNRTARALEAVLTSLPPIPTESILKRDHSQRVYTLAHVLAERGYRRLFITAGRGVFDGVRRFMRANGFDRFLEQRDFESPVFTNAWGVSDEDLFHRAVDELDALHESGQPFFATLLTVSNHRPFTYPAGRIPQPPEELSRENAVRYADWALGQFFERARTRPFFNRTIFVVMGDHGARVYGRQLFPMKSYRVPVLMILPDGELAGERQSTLASSIDVAPTVMGLLGGEYPSVFFGGDVLAADPQRSFAVMQHNHDVALLDARNRLVVLGARKSASGFQLDPRTFDLSSTGFPDPDMMADAIAVYQIANRMYYGEKCFPVEVERGPRFAQGPSPTLRH